ncbi:MFS transporter [Cryobacterium zongtaii]|uniref:MFS transporter n=1 Tax=Cryobacterium zongtaii TaxID=1259217 RepID=A0A2S3ZFJ7_9MICO|nr:MFS transporter [Cryobacterium zongtaii]POH65886.1 MFS transporter [Cryobacterium zongtaii]
MMTLHSRRLALFALFALPGLAISSWVTRTPAIRDLLGATTSEMGLILLGLSAGSMIGILASGPAVARWGARPVMLAGTIGVILSMPTIGVGAASSSATATVIGLFLFGLGMGGGEIAMNVEGADIEKTIGRPVLPALHGFFSLGTLVGAGAGIAFTATDVPVLWHLSAIGVVAVVIMGAAAPRIPRATGQVPRGAEPTAAAAPRLPLWRDTRLLLIAALVLAMALTEGTASDWLPLVMVDGHGFDATSGSAVYAGFAASMTIGRFIGGSFVARFGRAPVLRVGVLSAVVGMALVIFVDSQVAAVAAVVLWGLGASLGFPLALSAAGEGDGDPARRVAFAATVGYVALLVGPPVIGFLGDHSSLRTALIAPLILVAAAAFITPVVRPPETLTDRAGSPLPVRAAGR